MSFSSSSIINILFSATQRFTSNPSIFETPSPMDVVDKINELKHDQKKKPKEELLKKMINWVDQNQKVGKEAFEVSAKEVIDILKEIEKELIK